MKTLVIIGLFMMLIRCTGNSESNAKGISGVTNNDDEGKRYYVAYFELDYRDHKDAGIGYGRLMIDMTNLGASPDYTSGIATLDILLPETLKAGGASDDIGISANVRRIDRSTNIGHGAVTLDVNSVIFYPDEPYALSYEINIHNSQVVAFKIDFLKDGAHTDIDLYPVDQTEDSDIRARFTEIDSRYGINSNDVGQAITDLNNAETAVPSTTVVEPEPEETTLSRYVSDDERSVYDNLIATMPTQDNADAETLYKALAVIYAAKVYRNQQCASLALMTVFSVKQSGKMRSTFAAKEAATEESVTFSETINFTSYISPIGIGDINIYDNSIKLMTLKWNANHLRVMSLQDWLEGVGNTGGLFSQIQEACP